MTVTDKTPIRALVDRYAGVSEILDWYGVVLDGGALKLTVGQLAEREGLALDDLLDELADEVDFAEDQADDEDGYDEDDPDDDAAWEEDDDDDMAWGA